MILTTRLGILQSGLEPSIVRALRNCQCESQPEGFVSWQPDLQSGSKTTVVRALKTGVTVGGQRLGLECEDPTITEHFLFQQDILKFMLRIRNNPMNISYVFTIAQQLYSEISFLISIFKPINLRIWATWATTRRKHFTYSTHSTKICDWSIYKTLTNPKLRSEQN